MSLLNSASLVVTPNGYKAGTLYSVIPNTTLGDMTVVRATTATRVNSAGLIESMANNVPRLDYTDGTCPSLLVEPQRTNLLTYSEQFDNAAWTKSNTTISANAITAPDGTLTADKLVPSAVLSPYKEIWQNVSTTTGQPYTFSIFAKAGEYTYLQLIGNGTGFGSFAFNVDLSTGLETYYDSTGSTVNSRGIINYGNGWYKVFISVNAISTSSNRIAPQVIPAGNSVRGVSWTPDGTSGLYLWGAQVEVGSYATSYIPTTSAAVTRNADAISKTGISSLINSTEGVLFVETKGFADAITQPYSTYIQLSKNGESVFDNSLVLQHRNNGYLRVYVNGSATTNLNFNIDIDFTQNHKIAVLYKLNGYKLFIDGVAQSLFGTPTQTVFSGLDNLSFDLRGSNSWNAKIKNLIVFPSALSDTELTELTTL
jgi:hypothetical protein